ncbi:TrbG/VirB9 family P-type conjugative transfer protein [Thioalkalivibrio sp. ALE23]|uniref:TrbG/VirB9 family P-type conjugative transfer protein n=1 Tax=Thioalkalivibrio sp. ALE23 TaxID=1265495 RepID=UPI00047712F3|nr:TrbG/VirB9 family P-type conjugative transfer protein [Thioalkalivibrio sp. ALE23]
MEGKQRIFGVGLVGLAMALTSVGAAAQSPGVEGPKAYPFPQETNLVQFRYDPNRTYEILARPSAPTNIALAPDEELVALAIGDTVQWKTEDIDGHIFIKPIRSGVYTAGTIVTSQRSYQISLRAVDENSQWYQRVSWDYSSGGMVKQGSGRGARPGSASMDSEGEEAERPEPTEHTSPRVEDLNFGYEVRGSSGLVQNAFDDGEALWIRLEDDVQEVPAVFVSGRRHAQALANYRVEGNYIVIHRLTDRALLRIGDSEVVIERT